jgi:hypothetical protein
MNITRTQQILIGLLVAQLVLAAALLWPRPATSSGGEPLLGLKTSDITSLSITDDQGKTVKLAKQGDQWVAPDAGGYPADASKVTPILDKLTAIKTGRLVAQTSQSLPQLQVADAKFVRKVEIQGPNGAKTLYLGSSAGGGTSHVRLGGQDNVYLAGNLGTYEIDSNITSWIDPVYVKVTPDDVQGFTLKNASGEFVFTKDSQGKWTMQGLAPGEAFNENNVVSTVEQLSSLRMARPLGKTEDLSYGLAQPLAVATLLVKSGDQTKPVTLTVGSQDSADKSYVVKSSDSEYYVRVPDYTVQALLERKREAFLQQTPTPAAPADVPVTTPTP